MSNKSGTAEQVINLPKGGGEMKGLGETFAPNSFSGTGNFSVPISSPSGRNGFQPEINLVYSTGNGNSCFGLGWQLSIPGVSRKTARGIPQYQGQDTFILSGSEDLIPVAEHNEPGNTWIQYRPRTEGLFAIIRHHLDTANDYWEVKTKDGLINLYGTPNARGNDTATCRDPENPRNVFEWKLTKTQDTFGNRILYEYRREKGDENRPFDNIYLEHIHYLDYQDSNGEDQFLVRVDFEYEDTRPDPFSTYNAGFEIRTEKRCKTIRTYTLPDQLETPIKRYDLEYIQADWSQISLLKQVQVTGVDQENNTEESLPPLIFSYTQFEPLGKDFIPVQGRDFLTSSLGKDDVEEVDLFGNGLPDLIQMNGSVRYWKNLGKGKFDIPRTMQRTPAGLSIANPNVWFMDANGEGRADLVVHDRELSGYFPTKGDAQWDSRSFVRHKQTPSFSSQDPELKWIDLTGNGITDALRSGSRMECYFNDPKEGWKDTLQIERKDLEIFPNVNFSDPRIRLADMSGDGLQDIVMVSDGNIEYWPYMGFGKWGKRIHMHNSPRFPYAYDPKRILLGDIAGDGSDDVIYVDYGKVYIWINQQGNGFSERITIHGTPPISNIDDIRLLDLMGNGVLGILWSKDQAVQGRDHMFFLDLAGGIKPHLLNEMNNNMGAITKVEYKPSTYFYLEDEKDPETRWKTNLPFPVQVVSCVEIIDEISKNKRVSEYRYHHGHYDGAEREFRGFGCVEQIDTQSFTSYHENGLHGDAQIQEVQEKFFSPPTLSKTWFYIGPVGEEQGNWTTYDFSSEYWQGDPTHFDQKTLLHELIKELPRRAQRDAHRTLIGSQLHTEIFALDGHPNRENRPYTVSNHTYTLKLEFKPEDGPFSDIPRGTSGYIFFPINSIQRTTQWERGDDPMTSFQFSEDFDPYGQARKQIAIACPRGWRNMGDKMNSEDPFLSTYSINTYAYSGSEIPYIKGRLAKSSTYEILHQGEQSVWDINTSIGVEERLELIAESVNYFDGEAFEGLPFGEIGSYGLTTRTESLVITEEILEEAWRDKDGNTLVPPYLIPNNKNWPSEYPQEFKDQLSSLAGYTFYEGDAEHCRGYWITTCTKFDFQESSIPYNKGLPLAQKDALGRVSSITYDPYHFLPVSSEDALGLTIWVENDYRLFQPYLLTDPNLNKSWVNFSPLGFVTKSFLMGKENVREGDALNIHDPDAIPSSCIEYDFFAFMSSSPEARHPIFTKSVVREYHVYDSEVDPGRKEDTITSVEYYDGFSRLIQSRTQAEDILFGDPQFGNELLPAEQGAPTTTQAQTARIRQVAEAMNVVVSGWQLYNNKGQVVQQYEPFYSKGFDYANLLDLDMLVGQKVEQYYDPLQRVIKTINPDASEQRVILGIPNQLDNPEDFTPTPWESYTYDENDLAALTGHIDKVGQHNWYTPACIILDALGRTRQSCVHNRDQDSRGNWSNMYEIITKSTYDIRGNLLKVFDALGREAFTYTYDLTFDEEEGSQVWRIDSIDAGVRKMSFNVLGQEIERRDSKGSISLQAYDEGNRLSHFWARDNGDLSISLRQKLIYGDKTSNLLGQAKETNRLGQVYQHYDEAGLVEIPVYDFKGNPLSSSRRVIKTEALVNIAGGTTFQHFQVDWAASDHSLLEAKAYQTESSFDALNRPKQILYPEDVEGDRKKLLPSYNKVGGLQAIEIRSDNPNARIAGVKHIAYNAKGQRTLIAYENGLMTRYAYDDFRFWLKRLRTERYELGDANNYVYMPSGGMLQELGYEYDLVGNILCIQDRSPDAGIPNSQLGQEALDRKFIYDPIYRLISASGREQDQPLIPDPAKPWLQEIERYTQDKTATRAYSRKYSYDPAGNMLQLNHSTQGGDFVKTFSHQLANPNEEESPTNPAINNRLRSMTIGTSNPTEIGYRYDSNGNMFADNETRYYKWNHADQLHSFRKQANEGTAPSLEARYLYDAGGQRVKKIVCRQNGSVNSTTYIGGFFEYHTQGIKSELVQHENNTLHLMDGESRIALIRIGNVFDDKDRGSAIQYQLGDHLGNVHISVNDQGSWENREEQYPYGGTSFGGFEKKRYRFTSMERDEESGMSYHGARYYLVHLTKWISTDPMGIIDGFNLYTYSRK